MDKSLSRKVDETAFWQDFSQTLTAIPNTFLEVAFAEPGTSKFCRATYYESICSDELQKLTALKKNVSFLANCYSQKFSVRPNEITTRQGKDSFIQEKNILSLDVDFKDIDSQWSTYSPVLKLGKAKKIFKELEPKFASLPLWICSFSGNGLHFHFKMQTSLKIQDPKSYKALYENLLSSLTLLFEGKIQFDRSCCNVARLMRLPLSTNWKDLQNPIQGEVFYHNPDADTSSFIRSFLALPTGKKGKNALLQRMSLKQVLEFFDYKKFSSFEENSSQVKCSSPFAEDKTPSFYFEKDRKLFFDFSSGKGGDLFSLIGYLAGLDTQNQFPKILQIAKKICGVEKETSSRYVLREDGVWFSNPVEGEEDSSIWVCSYLEVLSYTRDTQSDFWGRLLLFKDKDDKIKKWAMPMELLAGDGLEVRRELLKRGLDISTNSKARNHLLSYIQSFTLEKRACCVERLGWHGDMYVLPEQVFSFEFDEEVVLQGGADYSTFNQRGSLEEWKQRVAEPCTGNSRLVFVLAFAFTPPLLALTGEESGGVHLVGPSSIGKTLALKIAGSVWGGGSLNGFLQKWRATVNGLEGLAQSRCDTLLVLDELSEIDAKSAGQAVYMLANGSGKRRLNKKYEQEKVSEWRTLFLSSGELTLKTLLSEIKDTQRGGQAVRLADIDADAGKDMGIFEELHGFETPQALVDHLRESSQSLFGHPIREFMEALSSEKEISIRVRSLREEFLQRLGQSTPSGQVSRVANRFSLAAAAGVLACEFGVLPFQREDVLCAVQTCFENWLHSYADKGSFENSEILSQIRSYLQQNAGSQFPDLNDSNLKQLAGKCSGYRKKNEQGDFDWIIPNEVFRKEMCKGFDHRQVIKVLRKEDLLIKRPGGPSSTPMRLPHLGMVRVYHIKSQIMNVRSETPFTQTYLKSVTA